MDKRGDLLIALVILISGPLLYVSADQLPTVRMADPMGTDGWPKALAVGLALAGLWLVTTRLRLWRATQGWLLADEGEEDEAGYSVSMTRVALFAGAMLAYVYALEPLGTVIATPLFIAAGLFVLNERRWRLIVPVALGLTAVVYLTYGVGLGVGLPMGTLRGS